MFDILRAMWYILIMKRFFINRELKVNSFIKIDGVEHNHIKNVMRLKIGDEIILVCGDEFDYLARITNFSKGDTEVEVLSREVNNANPKCDVTVYQALVKSDNMSLIVQKLTELGVKTLVPFESEFITSKDKNNKCQKLQEISNQSIKQCKRSIPIKVENTRTFSEMLGELNKYDIVIFANECEKSYDLNSLKVCDGKIALIIGSEGGFSNREISLLQAKGVKSISMGNRILRAETASISLVAVIMYLLGEWHYV